MYSNEPYLIVSIHETLDLVRKPSKWLVVGLNSMMVVGKILRNSWIGVHNRAAMSIGWYWALQFPSLSLSFTVLPADPSTSTSTTSTSTSTSTSNLTLTCT